MLSLVLRATDGLTHLVCYYSVSKFLSLVILFVRFAHVNRSRFTSFSSLLNNIPAHELAGFQNNCTHVCVYVYSFSERGFASFRLGLLQNDVFFRKAFKLFFFLFSFCSFDV